MEGGEGGLHESYAGRVDCFTFFFNERIRYLHLTVNIAFHSVFYS